ncbi:MAG: hypothetical protein WCF61_12770 [Terriglobales bacterium]
MKLKSLLVIALFVAACSLAASAQTFGFASAGSGLYCNYEQLNYQGTNDVFVGVDNLSACGSSVNATLVCIGATVPKSDGLEAYGKGVVCGDNIFAVLDGDPNAQWTYFSALECSKEKNGKFYGHYGWAGVAAFSGVYVGGNYGYLSCTIPGKNGVAPTRDVTIHDRKTK